MLPIGSLGIAPGRDVHVLANGIGDSGGGIECVCHVTGWSVRPPAPVHGVIEHGDDGARSLRWVRRSRNGWGWHDLVDVPIGEERERYRCDWGGGSAEVAVPAFALPPGMESATVRQQGTVAASLPLVIGQSG